MKKSERLEIKKQHTKQDAVPSLRGSIKNVLIGFTQQTDLVSLSELTVESGKLKVKESLRDN